MSRAILGVLQFLGLTQETWSMKDAGTDISSFQTSKICETSAPVALGELRAKDGEESYGK